MSGTNLTVTEGTSPAPTDFPNSTSGYALPVGTTDVFGQLHQTSDTADFFEFSNLVPGSNYSLLGTYNPFGQERGVPFQVFNTSGLQIGSATLEGTGGLVSGTVPADGDLIVDVHFAQAGNPTYQMHLDGTVQTTTFTGGGAPVAIEPSLAIIASGTLVSGTVAIGSGFTTGDVLNFTNQNGITGSYDSTTGTLTLSGTASIANYQSAVESVTFGFNPSNGDPTNGGGDTSRIVNWAVNNGTSVAASGASTLNVVHAAPTLTVGGGVTFIGGGSPVALDGTLAVSDPDSLGTLNSGTVSIANFAAGDILSATTIGSITASYNSATGVLTLSGADTLADYQQVLRSITYSVNPSNADPTGGGSHTSRTIDWTVNDGVTISNTGSSTLSVVHVAPTITAGGAVTFTGGGSPVALDPTISITDIDSNDSLSGAKVWVNSGSLSGDVLNYTSLTGLGITGSYNAATGTLTLSGTSSIANYETALASVAYLVNPANADPTGGGSDLARTIGWSVTDGSTSNGLSNTGSSVVDIVHVAPTVTAGGTVTFNGGETPVTLDPTLSLADVDSNGTLTGASVSIGTGFRSGDLLSVDGQADGLVGGTSITASYDASTGVLTLSGADTLANYAIALGNVGFSSLSNSDPTGGGTDTSRTINWAVTDGSTTNGVSNIGTSALDVVHTSPTISVGGTSTFTGGGTAVSLASAIGITDLDSSGILASATVAIGAGFIAGDTLTFTNSGSITGIYDTASGVLTLSGADSIADYQSALDSIAFSFNPSNGDPTGGGSDTSRTIEWAVNDGVAISNTGSSTLNVIHAAPTVTAGGTVTFQGNGSAVTLDPTLSLNDADSNGMLTGATISVGGFINGDTLNFTDQNGISGSYDTTTGVLTLTGAATVADYQGALDSISYGYTPGTDPTGGGSHISRSIDWLVTDGVTISNTGSSTLDVVHVAPTLTAAGTATYESSASAVVLDNGLALADDDSSGVLAGATVTIANGFLSGDALNFVNAGSITGSYDAGTGVLVLSGTASIAAYQSALASITYSSSNADPSNGATDPTREIHWTVTDGSSSNGVSNAGTTAIDVYGPPPGVAGTDGVIANFVQQGPASVLDSEVSITDADSTTLTSATVTIGNGFLTGDTLTANTGGTAITALFNDGTLTLSGTDTLADYQQVLRSVSYGSSAADPTNGGSDLDRTITWQVNDGRGGNALSNVGTSTIDTHVRPVVTTGSTVTFGTGGGPILAQPTLGLADTDTNPILSGTVAITGGLLSGDVLAFNDGSNIETFGDGATLQAAFDSLSGALTLTESPDGNQASVQDWQQALDSVTFDNPGSDPTEGGGDPIRTLTWTANTGDPQQTSVPVTSTIDVASPPVISGTATGQATTDEAVIAPLSGVTIGDPNIGQTETIVVTLSDPSNGTLSDTVGVVSGGTYTVTGDKLAVTQALDALVFTPTPHQIAPGDTVTTTFTITATDSLGATTSDSSTSVIATAVNDPPQITHATEPVGVPGQASLTPFAVLTVTDPDVGHTDTVTITMSNPAGGTFSNLSGGSYDAETGVYAFTGAPDAANAALAALVFTPNQPPAGSYVATTTFSVEVAGAALPPATDDTISVTTVTQVLGLSGSSTGDDNVQVSPDGTGLPAPVNGQNNEAVISAPTDGGNYSLPDGYQAMFLGGNADASLSDPSSGNAVLVGNSGNDTISASAGDDTITGGSGSNLFLVSGTNDVIGVTGTSTVSASGTNDTMYAGTEALTLIDSGMNDALGLSSGSASVTLSGSGAALYGSSGSVSVVDNGSNNAIGAGDGPVSATLSGSGAALYGSSGSVSVVDNGSNNAIGAGDGPVSATLSGSGTRIYGGSNTLTVDETGAASGVAIGAGSGDASVTVGGGSTTLYGGSGSLTVDVTGSDARVGLANGPAAITLAGSGAEIFGGSSTLSVDDLGTADTIAAGTGPATVTAGGANAVIVGGGGSLSLIGGANYATVYAGTGSTTVNGGTGAMTLYGGAGSVIDVTSGPGEIVYQAGAGAETLNAAGATGGAVINGGIDGAGQDLLIAGSGNDSLYAGTGSDTLTGGAGSDQFVFYRSVVNGTSPHDVITDFTGNDVVYLAGYGGDAASAALQVAQQGGGAVTLTLSDNTQITFLNVASTNALAGHIVST